MTEWLDPALLQGEVISDGPLSAAEMSMEVAHCCGMPDRGGKCSRNRYSMVVSVCYSSVWWASVTLKVMVEPVGGGPAVGWHRI
ncbi:single-stranded DNA-specific exonuclease [Salmonella enterica subsp. enterica]|uniref:Single-stranded DNA-specific exonuclease n=1 Tax=Salmonella enterica I TaxID=59201 RepID=A0A379W379_SALET|nr:single-stranded DNA-specific exonuclease [Salmonella enterica subsp. enterica]